MADTIPCISLWQPWASLCFVDCPTGDDAALKRHETRAYPPPSKYIGKRIGIHAAKRSGADLTLTMELMCERAFGRGIALPRGQILGTVLLVSAKRTEETEPGTYANRFAGDWTPGRWAWELADARPLFPPIPYKGKQGWFMADAELFALTAPRGPMPVDTGRLRDSFAVQGIKY